LCPCVLLKPYILVFPATVPLCVHPRESLLNKQEAEVVAVHMYVGQEPTIGPPFPGLWVKHHSHGLAL